MACPKTGFCVSINKVTTFTNGQTKQRISRTCYQHSVKPNYDVLQNITFVQGQTQCVDSTQVNKQTGVTTSTASNCVDVCQGTYCNTSTPTQSAGLSTGAIVGIVIGCVVALLLIVGLVVYCMKYKGRSQVPTNEPATEMN